MNMAYNFHCEVSKFKAFSAISGIYSSGIKIQYIVVIKNIYLFALLFVSKDKSSYYIVWSLPSVS